MGDDALVVVPLLAGWIEKDIPTFIFKGIGRVEKDDVTDPKIRSIVLFIQSCFCLREEHVMNGPITSTYVLFKFRPVSLRLAACDVGRCFCSGSLPAGVLREPLSLPAAENLAVSLRTFGYCTHSDNVCPECVDVLLETAVAERDTIPCLAKFCRALCEASTSEPGENWRSIAFHTANLISQSLLARALYFQAFEIERPYQSLVYEHEHKGGNSIGVPVLGNWLEEAKRCGEIFPGRPVVRPRLDFGPTKKEENSRGCSKKYPCSTEHSPGIFTVQCCCKHPKILGISVMEECEGVSMAMSILLSRFKHLPRVTYYDNACNFGKSAVIRVPWINELTRIACDRFHYRSHTCNSVNDPSAYPSLTDHQTSNAEALNRLWSASKSHSRHLNPDNLMAFLGARAAFMNLRSLYRESNKSSDIEDANIFSFALQYLPCECYRCSAPTSESSFGL